MTIVTPAWLDLRALLREWTATPFFEKKSEWRKWADDFRARVIAALVATDEPQQATADPKRPACIACRFVFDRRDEWPRTAPAFQCRRHAPAPRFPGVAALDFCGEFEPQPTEVSK